MTGGDAWWGRPATRAGGTSSGVRSTSIRCNDELRANTPSKARHPLWHDVFSLLLAG
jgi:hypothetical protein